MSRKTLISKIKKNMLPLALMATTSMVPLGALAQDGSPLETGTYLLPGMASSDTLRKGALLGAAGQVQANTSTTQGTGNQLYHFHLEYGVTDRLQIGAAIQRFEDPVFFAGRNRDIGIRGLSGQIAYKFVDLPRIQLTAQASIERYRFLSRFWFSRLDGPRAIGSVHLPGKIKVTDALDLHFSAGLSSFPDQLNGRKFYGLIPHVGLGASYRFNERFNFYGLVNVPFGENGNAINSSGGIENLPVWTVGGSFNVTPKAALDVYATNGLGATPTTRILSFPGSDQTLLGVRFSYTPGVTRGYRSNYRGISGERDDRQKRLQFHGFSMASADTLDPGRFIAWGNIAENESRGAGGSFSPDQDIEFGVAVELFSQDGTVPASITPGTGTRVRLSTKLRLLDQHNGSPFSLSGLFIAGRAPSSRLGSLYLSAPMSYQFNDRLTFGAEPKFGAFGSQRYTGLAAGVNYELAKGLDLIAEAGIIDGANGNVWSVGARYTFDRVPVSFDIQATNTIGNHGLGTMIAQDNVRISGGMVIALDTKPLWKKLSRVTFDRLR